jgi:hypothetical protein
MKPNLLMAIILPVLTGLITVAFVQNHFHPQQANSNPYARIGDIPVPAGFERMRMPKNSFGAWIRNCPLRKDKTVYLYNGKPKTNQNAQFAVLDLPIGHRDLQQCADAIMRLRADYLRSLKINNTIDFRDNENRSYLLHLPADSIPYIEYLDKVFEHCGTASLEKQLRPLGSGNEICVGDVLIHGGFPGHAMLVADMALNNQGRKIFLLLQGFMPAQDIHIVCNPSETWLSPWYTLTDSAISTPEYQFSAGNFKAW